MSAIHRWFRSGPYWILAHLDLPQGEHIGQGVILVPSFGWEDVCAWRALRFMARQFAARGIPTLRFDLPATGDSSGGAGDPGILNAWIQSLSDAASELRAVTGVRQICGVGIHLGGMLATAAIGQGAAIDDLVLWGGAVSGRAILREWKAFRNLEISDNGAMENSPEPARPGLEVLGFFISPETRHALETLDLSSLPSISGRRILMLSRDKYPPDRKLVHAFQTSGCTVTIQCGNGYSDMVSLPHEAIPPIETTEVIVEFLTGNSNGPLPVQPAQGSPAESSGDHLQTPALELTDRESACIAPRVVETVYTVSDSQDSMFGVLAAPDSPSSDWCVLWLNPGAVRHIGPNRMWVDAARRWAERGIASLRVDLQGIGESDGEQILNVPALYSDRLIASVETVMESLRSRMRFRRFAVVGLCSGAWCAFHAALRNRDIGGAILLNPRLFFWDPQIDQRRLMRRTVHGLTDPAEWRRLATGDVQAETVRKIARLTLDRFRRPRANAERELQIDPDAMARAREALDRNQTCLTMVFAEGEPLLREMEEEGQLEMMQSNSRIRCLRLGNAGHTFRPLWAQERVHDVVDRELAGMLQMERAGARLEL